MKGCILYFMFNKNTQIFTPDTNRSRFPEEATALDNIGSHYESIPEGNASVPVAANSEEVDKERTYESITDKKAPMSDAATQQQCRKPVMSVAPVVATHVSYPGSPKAKSESQHADEIYQNMSSPEPILARELERYIRKKKNGEMNELYHEFDVSCNHYIKYINNIICRGSTTLFDCHQTIISSSLANLPGHLCSLR